MGKSKKSKSTKSTEPDPNLYSSSGEFTLPNGDMYIGDYCAHRCGLIWRQGHGIYKTQDGHLYEGEWVDDKLVENQEIVIKYPGGSEYHGCIYKNKYHGPATYVLDCKMDLSATFDGNKPVGQITLIDCDGKLWVGNARENTATLLPENIFYLNLTKERGKGLPIDDQSLSREFIGEEEHNEKDELPDREWEKIIFAESTKTDKQIEATDSKWWTNYDQFKRREAFIAEKVQNEEALEEEDRQWLHDFSKYKEARRLKQQEKKELKEKESVEVALLNKRFQSAEFADSCPPVSVIYPNWNVSNECSQSVAESYEVVTDKSIEARISDVKSQYSDHENREKVQSKIRTKVLFLDVVDFDDEAALSTDYESVDFTTQENSDNFDKYINYLDYNEVHFTEGKEQEKQLQEPEEPVLAQSAKVDSQRSVKLKIEDDDADKTIKKQTSEVGSKKKGDKIEMVKEKPIVPQPIDEEKAFEARIKMYIEDFIKDNVVDVSSEEVTKKRDVHVHSFGVGTDSINDIPKELFKK